MTILFVGNTPADFLADSSGASMAHNTDTTHRDSNYVPNDIRIPVVWFEGNPFGITLDSPSTDFWIHFRYRSGKADFVNGYLLEFLDNAHNNIGRLDLLGSRGGAMANGDSIVHGPEFVWPTFTSFTIDVRIQLSGGDIITSYYHNGSLLSTATSANTGGKGGVSQVVFSNYSVTVDSSGNDRTYFSEIIMTDAESTVGWRLACLEPAGAGFHSDFAGGFAELADADLASAAGTDTAGHRVSSTLSTYNGPTSPAGIRAVVAKAVASKGGTGPQTLKQSLRISATDYDGAAEALINDAKGYMEVWDNNPATVAPWATSDLTGLEVGVKSEA